MPAAVILPDHSIAAVLMADADVDAMPPGFPAGAVLVNAPDGCNETWSYDPATGFKSPVPTVTRAVNKGAF